MLKKRNAVKNTSRYNYSSSLIRLVNLLISSSRLASLSTIESPLPPNDEVLNDANYASDAFTSYEEPLTPPMPCIFFLSLFFLHVMHFLTLTLYHSQKRDTASLTTVELVNLES